MGLAPHLAPVAAAVAARRRPVSIEVGDLAKSAERETTRV